MVKTNEESLLKVALVGEITHPAEEGAYMTAWDGTSMIGLGRGGINYNVKVGDPCFGWAWGEKVQSGATADGVGNDREKGSFRSLSCIGNEVRIVDKEAKGGTGVVVGKIGYMPGGAHHVVLHFDDDILDKLSIGDKVQMKAHGIGLELVDYPGVRVVSTSPKLLKSWGIEEKNGKLHVPVVKVVPAEYVGQGSGGSPAENRNWDLQTQSPDAVEYLKDLMLGDMVLLEDILTAYGRGYYEGAVTVGVVASGASSSMGQGIGVTVLLTGKEGELQPKLDPNANLTKILILGGGE